MDFEPARLCDQIGIYGVPMLSLIFLVGFDPAFASPPSGRGPHRCEAVFEGPAEGCGLAADLQTSGSGRSERRARRSALGRMQEALSAAAALQALNSAQSKAEVDERAICPAPAANVARLFCFPEPELAADRLCHAVFEARDCYHGLGITLDGTGWRIVDLARDEMCAQVDQELSSAAPEHALECRIRCLQETKVRCVGEP